MQIMRSLTPGACLQAYILTNGMKCETSEFTSVIITICDLDFVPRSPLYWLHDEVLYYATSLGSVRFSSPAHLVGTRHTDFDRNSKTGLQELHTGLCFLVTVQFRTMMSV